MQTNLNNNAKVIEELAQKVKKRSIFNWDLNSVDFSKRLLNEFFGDNLKFTYILKKSIVYSIDGTPYFLEYDRKVPCFKVFITCPYYKSEIQVTDMYSLGLAFLDIDSHLDKLNRI